MRITIETFKGKSDSEKMNIIINDIQSYAHNSAKYVYNKHNMTLSYCENYITSGLYTMFIDRLEKLQNDENYGTWEYDNLLIYSLASTKRLVRMILANSNMAYYNAIYDDDKCEYVDNIKSTFNHHIIDIVDVLEQRENRANRKAQKHNVYFDGDYTFNVSTKVFYNTPEYDYMKKIALENAIHFVKSIKKSEIDRLKDIKNVNVKTSRDKSYIRDFKKRYSISEVNYKDIIYLLEAYL